MRKLLAVFRVVATALTVAAVVYAIRTTEPSGRFLGVPYEFRFPTLERVRERLWKLCATSIRRRQSNAAGTTRS